MCIYIYIYIYIMWYARVRLTPTVVVIQKSTPLVAMECHVAADWSSSTLPGNQSCMKRQFNL